MSCAGAGKIGGRSVELSFFCTSSSDVKIAGDAADTGSLVLVIDWLRKRYWRRWVKVAIEACADLVAVLLALRLRLKERGHVQSISRLVLRNCVK